MAGTASTNGNGRDNVITEEARRDLEQAETGDKASADKLREARKADPQGAQAAEQEASEAPEGRGLAR